MRYINVPMVLLNEFKQIVDGTINISPFAIEAYYSDEIEYVGAAGQTNANITTVIAKSGRTYELLIDIEEFEKQLAEFYNQ